MITEEINSFMSNSGLCVSGLECFAEAIYATDWKRIQFAALEMETHRHRISMKIPSLWKKMATVWNVLSVFVSA